MLKKSSRGNGKHANGNGNGNGNGKHDNGENNGNGASDHGPDVASAAAAQEQIDHDGRAPDGSCGSRLPSPSALVKAWPVGDAWLRIPSKQHEAIALMVQGYFDAQIAREIGVSRITLWRWKAFDPVFRRLLAKARAEAYQQRVDRQGLLLDLAGDALERVLRGNRDQKETINVARLVWSMAGCLKPPMPVRSRRSRAVATTRQPTPTEEATPELAAAALNAASAPANRLSGLDP